jgi:ATP-binding cassette subfamily B protein/subfamily B ATP-binding cassette protein MsbA
MDPKPMNSGIRFEDVHFVYPGTEKEVLKGISFDVPAGSTVALVGESGGGKSTMMDLMARFFDPVTGIISIDGNDIRNFTVKDHRSRVGIVTQEIFLFYGSVHQNISYGRDLSRDDVIQAARLANAHDFIEALPQGYDTVLGERGFTLSGGQRQRIAIARALLRNPEILILDEATSALDTESERLVQDALSRLFKNRTTFVIAHRLSTIETADIILVISGGQIVERGTHDDLMKNPGMYARLQEIARQATLPV